MNETEKSVRRLATQITELATREDPFVALLASIIHLLSLLDAIQEMMDLPGESFASLKQQLRAHISVATETLNVPQSN